MRHWSDVSYYFIHLFIVVSVCHIFVNGIFLKILWDNFFKFGTNIRLNPRMNELDFGGQISHYSHACEYNRNAFWVFFHIWCEGSSGPEDNPIRFWWSEVVHPIIVSRSALREYSEFATEVDSDSKTTLLDFCDHKSKVKTSYLWLNRPSRKMRIWMAWIPA